MAIKATKDRKNYNVVWECLCDCGNLTYKRAGSLKAGYAKSCGCLHKLPYGEASYNYLYNKYKRGAANRGYEFLLTNEDFRQLTQQPCHYCGKSPSHMISYSSYNGDYVYNGIDRKDNTIGYVSNNVVTCCGECNKAKGSVPYEQFVLWIQRLVKYNEIKNNI